MNCPLCGHELKKASGPINEPATMLVCNDCGCTASPEFWDKVRGMRLLADQYTEHVTGDAPSPTPEFPNDLPNWPKQGGSQ